MKNKDNDLKEFIKKIVNETLIDENDLMVKPNSYVSWEEMAETLTLDVKVLIGDINVENYKDALKEIDAIVSELKVWKHRIINGSNQNKPEKQLNQFSIDEDREIVQNHPWYKDNWNGGFPRHTGNVRQYLKPGAIVYNAKGESKVIKTLNDSHLTFTDGTIDHFLHWFPKKPINQ